MHAVKITTGGTVEVVDYPADDSLHFLQACVGGYVEAIDFSVARFEVTMWLNEEGKVYGLPRNGLATWLAQDSIMLGDWIAGDVVITGLPDNDGNTQGLTDYETAALKTWLGV